MAVAVIDTVAVAVIDTVAVAVHVHGNDTVIVIPTVIASIPSKP